MVNSYTNRDLLKAALSIPASATGAHDQLDAAIEGVCRDIDKYVGFRFYGSSGVRYYRPRQAGKLDLDYPLVGVDAIAIDADGDSTYESTLSSADYHLTPYNATEESPKQPWWGIELRSDSSAAFPKGIARGARITGTWGYYNERDETTAKPATGITTAATVWDMTGASNLHPGQTIRVDDEQVFIQDNALSGSATAATSGQITVKRAVNGSVAATHSSNSTMSIYTYPVVDRAALYQAQMDYRGQDAPLGIAGEQPFGTQRLSGAGLHPFVKRMLAAFRTPVAG